MKKDMSNIKGLASFALATIGIGTLVYSYAQMHPLKTKKAIKDMKNMVKDLK